ncbi:MAG: hypothetical protein Q4D02_04110 [Clostridia bacterium]|nr:hypothetical protein [Clostridia bacterium]
MYYDNKSSFYIRQYGPKVLVIVLIVLIASTGLYIYMASRKTPTVDVTQQTIAQQGSTTSQEEQKVDENVASLELPANLEKLKPLETATVKIASIENNGEIVVISGETRFKAKLIGLDFNTVEPDTIYQMGQDIANRQVEIAFDNIKCTNDTANIYIYLNDELYNAKLLEQGKLKLNSNDINKLLLKELTESQAYAKQTRAGIWEY